MAEYPNELPTHHVQDLISAIMLRKTIAPAVLAFKAWNVLGYLLNETLGDEGPDKLNDLEALSVEEGGKDDEALALGLSLLVREDGLTKDENTEDDFAANSVISSWLAVASPVLRRQIVAWVIPLLLKHLMKWLKEAQNDSDS